MTENNFTNIDEILNVTNRIKPVEPKPFFYSRLRAKMEQRSFSADQSVSSLIPMHLKICGVAIIIINAWFFTNQIVVNNSTSNSQALASFYQFNSLNLYTTE